MTSKELREKYFKFFEQKGHKLIPSASLIPEGDASTLFISAGMQPLVPYLLGEKHPEGKRLVDVQKCLRTEDIEEVGTPDRLTFFEMLGNWSLGDYGREDSIPWSLEFLVSKEWLGMDKSKLHVTVFKGENGVPEDKEACKIWQNLGIPDERIHRFGKEDNFWIAGETGPCGPDTEMFFDTGRDKCGVNCRPGCHCGKYFEVWNNVFIEYNKKADGTYEKLQQPNVDTGMGVERTLSIVNGENDVYLLDVLKPLIDKLEELTNRKYKDNLRRFRVIADHVRAVVFLLSDSSGLIPSNLDQGYILRRLIRRAFLYVDILSNSGNLVPTQHILVELARIVPSMYPKELYPELHGNAVSMQSALIAEVNKTSDSVRRGTAKFRNFATHYWKPTSHEKTNISSQHLFDLVTTFGLPFELIEIEAKKHNIQITDKNREEFRRLFEEHREKSRTATKGKFKGGLGEESEQTKKLHTATHLLLAALRKVLGEHVEQRGSNINPERLRFDFTHDEKMTPEQIKEVEDLINKIIDEDREILQEEMTPEEAKTQGAMGIFDHKYGNKVKVYTVVGPGGQWFSKEICGGPHVKRTGELGHFKIKKEQSSSGGVRRIKATLENKK